MYMSFVDKNVNGFVFGQMTATGYKTAVMLDHDDQDRDWNAGDIILYGMAGEPQLRIVPLNDGYQFDAIGEGKMQTFSGNIKKK